MTNRWTTLVAGLLAGCVLTASSVSAGDFEKQLQQVLEKIKTEESAAPIPVPVLKEKPSRQYQYIRIGLNLRADPYNRVYTAESGSSFGHSTRIKIRIKVLEMFKSFDLSLSVNDRVSTAKIIRRYGYVKLTGKEANLELEYKKGSYMRVFGTVLGRPVQIYAPVYSYMDHDYRFQGFGRDMTLARSLRAVWATIADTEWDKKTMGYLSAVLFASSMYQR